MSELEKTYHLYLHKRGGNWSRTPIEIKTLCNKDEWVLQQEGGYKQLRDATIPQDFTNCKECLLTYWYKKVREHNMLKGMMMDKGIIH